MPTAHAPSRHVLRKQTRAISTALLARANVLPAYLEDGPACGLVAVERRGEQDALVAIARMLAAKLWATKLDADALRVTQAFAAALLERLLLSTDDIAGILRTMQPRWQRYRGSVRHRATPKASRRRGPLAIPARGLAQRAATRPAP